MLKRKRHNKDIMVGTKNKKSLNIGPEIEFAIEDRHSPESNNHDVTNLILQLTHAVNTSAKGDPLELARSTLAHLTGHDEMTVSITLKQPRYIVQEGKLIPRDQLPDTDPQSWPALWMKFKNLDVKELLGQSWQKNIKPVDGQKI